MVAFSRSSGIYLPVSASWALESQGHHYIQIFKKNLGIAISPALTSHISKGLRKIKCLPMSVAIQRAFIETCFG